MMLRSSCSVRRRRGRSLHTIAFVLRCLCSGVLFWFWWSVSPQRLRSFLHHWCPATSRLVERSPQTELPAELATDCWIVRRPTAFPPRRTLPKVVSPRCSSFLYPPHDDLFLPCVWNNCGRFFVFPQRIFFLRGFGELVRQSHCYFA